MIVRRLHGRLLLITQPNHARLAGRIMQQCVPLGERPRRASILTAIAEHDGGWTAEDASPAVDAKGEVVDFISAPIEVRHRVWPRAVERLKDDPWAAALVAQHAVTVYDRFRTDPAWTAFFSDMEAARDASLAATSLTLDDLLPDYAYVRLGDLISLVFCTGWSDPQRFERWIVGAAGDRIIVEPDIFGGTAVAAEVEAAEMPPGPFGSTGELRKAYANAPRTTLAGVVE